MIKIIEKELISLLNKIQNNENVIECEICLKTFDMKRKLKRHILRVHEEKKYICDELKEDGSNCESKFAEQFALVRHKRKIHIQNTIS